MAASRRVNAALLFVACLTFDAPGASAQAPVLSRTPSNTARRQTGATRVTESLRIDGSLNEAAWNRADVARDFTQSEPREGQPATEATEVMVMFDDHFLYVGARMRDSDPAHEIVNDIRKDFREDDQDDFEVIIDTFRDRRNGYVFIVNPEGGRVDRQIANEGREINSSWDAVWDVKTQRSAEGWTAEMRIPFRTLRFDPGADQSWGINFSRRIRRKNEVTFWAPVPRAYNLMRLSYAGDVTGLHPGQAGRDIRV
ncbi:MAG TPA: carbohydrate binding family 9 domain-containing protein, partial [Gemmatimonadaceae bacterium]|nr:carbohydrate binding family 9 domain-containing protein [Gemmatimonadaceae bacterium]